MQAAALLLAALALAGAVPAAFTSRARLARPRHETDWVDFEVSADGGAADSRVADGGAAEGAPAFRFAEDEAVVSDYSAGCIDAPFAVCVGTAKKATPFAADAVPKGLVGRWTFDDQAAQDHSGHMNTVSPVPSVGPGFGGDGASAHVTATQGFRIAHQPAYSSRAMTVSLWIYLLDEGFGANKPIFLKGTESKHAPGIRLQPQDRKVVVSVHTAEGRVQFASRGAIPLKRWTHLTYVQDGRLLALYLNGITDAEKILPPPGVVPNKAPIYVGKAPWTAAGIDAFIDEISIYDRAIPREEIRAVGNVALPGIGSDFVRFGCGSCTLGAARDACPLRYHLCSRQELRGGALTVVDALGWAKLNAVHVWAHESLPAEEPPHGLPGMGVCCKSY